MVNNCDRRLRYIQVYVKLKSGVVREAPYPSSFGSCACPREQT